MALLRLPSLHRVPDGIEGRDPAYIRRILPRLCRVAEAIARGIAGRHLVAGLEQLRHHLEFELPE